MTKYKADFIKVPTDVVGFQTMPVEPEDRLPESNVRIELCVEDDVDKIAEGLYAAFGESFWSKMEPPSIRETDPLLRQQRLARRLRPTFHPSTNLTWVKAVHTPSSTIVGIAGWNAPGNPIHNPLRHSAYSYYDWNSIFSLSDEDVAELWRGTDTGHWDMKLGGDDEIRVELMRDEPHWHLAPLFTWPEWQGKGVGTKLLNWAIEKADATTPVTPLYLESAPSARPVYMHHGFVPCGKTNMVRRGPAVVRGLEAEEDEESGRIEKDKNAVEVVVKEAEFSS